MIPRFRAWRRTPAGIWAEWFSALSLIIALTATSYALGWHWAITGGLALWAAGTGAAIALMLSIRNDLGDTLSQEPEPVVETGALAMMRKRRKA